MIAREQKKLKRVGKKGAELSVNVIIIAIIAMLVLVVLIAIFTGKLSWFNRGTRDVIEVCPTTGKPPVQSLSQCPGGSGVAYPYRNPQTKKIETWYCCNG